MKNTCIFVAIAMIAVNSFAAYVVFNKTNTPISQADFDRASAIINSYSYPQVLIDKSRLQRIFTKAESSSSQEETFIRENIKMQLSHLDIMFLPDTLYEMFLIANPPDPSVVVEVEKTIFPRKSVSGSMYDQIFAEVDKRCTQAASCVPAQLNIFNQYNNAPLINKIGLQINQNILDMLRTNKIDPNVPFVDDDPKIEVLLGNLFKLIGQGSKQTLADVEKKYEALIKKNKEAFKSLRVAEWAAGSERRVEELRMGKTTYLEDMLRLGLFADFITVLNLYKAKFDEGDENERAIIDIIEERKKVFENFKEKLHKENLVPDRGEIVDKSKIPALLDRVRNLKQDHNSLLVLMSSAFNGAANEIVIKPIIDFKLHARRMESVRKMFPAMSQPILLHVAMLQVRAHMKDEMLLARGSSGIKVGNAEGQELDAFGVPDSPFMSNDAFTPSRREEILSNKTGDVSKLIDYSISLGNSLLAGIYFDAGACGWSYMLSAPFGYMLTIKKSDPRILKYLFIAPTHPIVAFFGKGEFFHSRSKLVRSATSGAGVSILGGGVPQIINVEGNETPTDIAIALRSYYLTAMKLITYKESRAPGAQTILLKDQPELEDKLYKAFVAHVENEFDVFVLGEHYARQKYINEEIRRRR